MVHFMQVKTNPLISLGLLKKIEWNLLIPSNVIKSIVFLDVLDEHVAINDIQVTVKLAIFLTSTMSICSKLSQKGVGDSAKHRQIY